MSPLAKESRVLLCAVSKGSVTVREGGFALDKVSILCAESPHPDTGEDIRMTIEGTPSDRLESSHVGKTLLHVAWLAILIGVALEALLLVLSWAFGTFKNGKPFIADLVQKISWSVIVCVGLALGATVARARDVVMGLMGLLAAPLAFSVARGMHKGAMEALSVATDAAGGPSPFLIASIKGLEYGLLGFALSAVQKQSWGGALAHTVAGLTVGVLFGGAILFFSIEAAAGPIPHSALIARAVNEILFPVGCALVIFSAEVLGKQLPK
jgi:hypothetical protein